MVLPLLVLMFTAGGTPDRLSDRYGGDTLAIIRRAARVDAYRLVPKSRGELVPKSESPAKDALAAAMAPSPQPGTTETAAPTEKWIDGNLVSGEVDQLGPTMINALRASLDNPRLVPPTGPKGTGLLVIKGCIFQPGVALRFVDGKRSTTVLLCFVCGDLQVVENGRQFDIGPVARSLLETLTKVFPQDAPLAEALARVDATGDDH